MKNILFALILIFFLTISCTTSVKELDFGYVEENCYINKWINLKIKAENGWLPIQHDDLLKTEFPNEHVNYIGIEKKEDLECINGLGEEKKFIKDKKLLYARPFALNYNNEATVFFEIFKKNSKNLKLKTLEDFVKLLEEKLRSSSIIFKYDISEILNENMDGIDFTKFSVEIDYGFPEKVYVDYLIKEKDDFFIVIMMNHYKSTEEALNDFVENNIEII